MNNFRRVAFNTLFLTISEALLMALGVVWIIFLARNISIAEYGRYNFVNAFIGIFSFLPDLGVGLIVIREIAKQKEKAPKLLGNSLILNTSLASITFFLSIGIAFILGFDQQLIILVVIASLTLFLSTLRAIAVFYFDGVEKMQISAIFNTTNTVLLLAGGFLGYLFHFGLFGIFIGMLIGTSLSLLLDWIILLKKFITPHLQFQKSIIVQLLLDGLPLGVAFFASSFYTKIDSLVLGRMISDEAVGIYNSAIPFASALIQLLNVPFIVAVYPALTRLFQEDSKRFKKAFIKSIIVILLWSIPATLVVYVASNPLITYIFGSKYDSAIPILRTLIFFVPFASVSALLYRVLIVLNQQKIYFYISILGVVINIALNIILIPLFQIQGASYSAIITQIILTSLYAIAVFIHIRHT